MLSVIRVYDLAKTVLVYDNEIYSGRVYHTTVHVSATLIHYLLLTGLRVDFDDLVLVGRYEFVRVQDHAAFTSSVKLSVFCSEFSSLGMENVLLVSDEPHLRCGGM